MIAQDNTKIKLNDALRAHEDSLMIDLHSDNEHVRRNARIKLNEFYYALYLADVLTFEEQQAKRNIVQIEYDMQQQYNGGGKVYTTFSELLA